VVIASHDAEDVIAVCLAALESQCRREDVEVIVADSSSDDTANVVAHRFPWVRLLHVDDPLPVHVLRGQGIAAAGGDVIAILDPFSVAASDWVEQVIAAHSARPNFVIGGAVGLYRPAERSWRDWALYFNEYGLFMPPIRQGETWLVPGSNVSYKRTALFDGTAPRYPVFWKTFANWDIERERTPLWLEPAIRVDLNKPIPYAEFLRTRFLHGRCFGGMRVARAGALVRVARTLSTPAVPGLLLWRWTRGIWPKRRFRGRYLAVLPAVLLLFGIWALGEACGYAAGTRDACERLFY